MNVQWIPNGTGTFVFSIHKPQPGDGILVHLPYIINKEERKKWKKKRK